MWWWRRGGGQEQLPWLAWYAVRREQRSIGREEVKGIVDMIKMVLMRCGNGGDCAECVPRKAGN